MANQVICVILSAGSLCPLIFIWRCIVINTELQINEEIRDREVRLIGADGAQLGIVPVRRALELAEEAELDLVKIVPNAQPPVCKLLDYDKHRYEQSKREKELRKNQKVIEIKEVQLSATIGENDVAIKARNAVKFLQDGNKVKVSIRFRGRQITHTEIGMQVMNDFIERVKDYAVVERRPTMEGRNMLMILAPKPAEKPPKAERPARPEAPAAQA
jgi:translation initiation factor IF-3